MAVGAGSALSVVGTLFYWQEDASFFDGSYLDVLFDNAVNVTLGLPKPRTSPDHGTAFAIAGKGLADPSSMISAIRLACELA